MKRTALLSATILALALPLAAAAEDWTPGANFMTNWDYDGDGKVTAAEVLERRGDLFDGFDADEDGVLSAEELADHNAMRDAMQAGQDRTDQAMRGWGQPQGQGFGRGPGQGRGGWGRGLMQAPQGFGYGQPQPGWGPGYGRMGGPMGGWGQPGRYGYGPGWGGQPGWGQPQGWGGPQGFGQPGMGPEQMQQQMHAGLDADNDGKITRDEFVKAGEGWFARFDRDGDGEVTADDFGRGRRW